MAILRDFPVNDVFFYSKFFFEDNYFYQYKSKVGLEESKAVSKIPNRPNHGELKCNQKFFPSTILVPRRDPKNVFTKNFSVEKMLDLGNPVGFGEP